MPRNILIDNFPEIKHVVAKIGTAEVPTDPMAVEDADIMIIMRPFKEWTSARSRAEMVDKMKTALDTIPDVEFNFSQPIQLRFNELMTGAKADIAIKLYGEDMEELYSKAREAARYVEQVPGADDVLVEQAMGLPQLVVHYDRAKIARYGINIEDLNTIIRTAYAGESAGIVFENERRFDLVVRLDADKVRDFNINKLFIRTNDGIQLPMTEVASIELVSGPLQINRDETKRRIVIGVNVRDADIQQVVSGIQEVLEENIELKPGYYFEYGGQFENLQNAIDTLLVVIPVALFLILLLLFIAFKSLTYTLVVFSTVPLSLIGGILALWLRGLPFSISAGVGFIALFGVAVLNGILMINHFIDLSKRGLTTSKTIAHGTPHLLRPVFLTGLVASLGFVPMAIATSAGAEVQRPLATVVIGGLIISTVLTLLIIPVFYCLVNKSAVIRRRSKSKKALGVLAVIGLMLFVPMRSDGQQAVTLDQAIEMAKENSPRLRSAQLAVEQVQAARGESWELAPASFDYSWGQLNGRTRKDRQYSVQQSFGSVITPFYKNALVKQQVRTGELYRQLVEKEITAEVKRAWTNYLFALDVVRLYAEQNQLADELKRIGEVRHTQGEITLLEKNMTTTLAASMKSRSFQAEEELKLAAARLKWACWSDVDIIPTETAFIRLEEPPYQGLVEIHMDYFRSRASESQAALRVEKSRWFPELTAGYIRQDILPDKGLNAWTVGVAFPVFFNSQRSKVRQARIGNYIARNESDMNIRLLEQMHRQVDSELMRYDETIRYYESSALNEANSLIESARVQLKYSETDISDFIQAVNSALEIKRAYADAIYQYNVAIIEHELYN